MEKEIQEFIEKVKGQGLDLSSDQDLSIAIMNLISIEEHFFFTGAKTGKSEYYELLRQAREMRKELLKKLITEYEGEVWCLSKHLLAASMRLMEVGTKHLGKGEKEEAEDLFKKSYQLYSMFWGLILKAIKPADLGLKEEVKKIEEDKLNVHDQGKTDFLGKLGEMVKKLVDCCKE